METLVIIGLAIAVVVLLVLYIRERKACNSYINAETNFKRDILNAKNQVSHFQHHSSMHEEAFQNAELKIKSLGFSGVDDNQLADPVTIEKVSKIRASLEASSKKRFAEEQKKRREAELAEQAVRQARIKQLADEERKRLAVIQSKEKATRDARRYRNNGSIETSSDGLMSFIPAIGAITYADAVSSGGGFSGSGGSYSDSGSGGSFSSDSGGGGGGGGE